MSKTCKDASFARHDNLVDECDHMLSPAARAIVSGSLFTYDHEIEWVGDREVAADPPAGRFTISRFGSEADATSSAIRRHRIDARA